MNEKLSSSVDLGKNVISFLRDLLIFVVIILLLFFPKKINSILSTAGFEEGSFGDFKWKSGLAKSDLALKEASVLNLSLKQQLDSATVALQQAYTTISNCKPDTSLEAEIQRIKTNNVKMDQVFDKTTATVTSTIRSNATLVEKVQQEQTNAGQWGVVYGADLEIDKARYEIDYVAPKILGITDAQVYYRQGFYRSVALADDRGEAEEILKIAKAKRRPDAYIVSMSSWCPVQDKKDNYIECSKK